MAKKIFAAAIALMLSLCTLTAFAYQTPEYIKVGLHFGTDSVNSFSVTCEGGARIGHTYEYNFYPQTDISVTEVLVEKGGGAYLRTTTAYPTLTDALDKAQNLRKLGVYAYGGYIDGNNYVMFGLYSNIDEAENSKSDLAFTELELESVNLDTKAIMVTADGFNLIFRHDSEIFAVCSSKGGYVKINGAKYYGYMLADRIHSSAISVVNMVSTDDYVACVVGSEMYSSWHIEALKAQAVIARTYAMTTTSYNSYGIDVTDDTRTQAYKGISAETQSTRRAADETSGSVVLYNGSPAQTYFCSSSGGKTADVYSAWGGGAGLDYLVSVDDAYEDKSISSWSVTYTADEIKAKLAKSGIDIGTVTNVVVTDRGENDERVRKLRFDGTNGSHSVSFEKCRTLLGLKSQYYYITSTAQNLTSNAHILTADKTKAITFNNVYVLGKNGQRVLREGASTLSANGSGRISSWQSSGEATFTFDGGGSGHGIGLSQYGAKGMAEAGYSYDEILMHYYPGTTLSN